MWLPKDKNFLILDVDCHGEKYLKFSVYEKLSF